MTDPLPAQCGFMGRNDAEFPPASLSCAASSIHWPASRSFPSANAKPIRLRANFYILQKLDGTGNFSEKDPEDIAFLNDWINYCNESFSTLKVLSNDCNNVLYRGAKIEIIPKLIFLRDEQAWNNDNSKSEYQCPTDSNFHLIKFDSAAHQRDPGAINVYLTASGSIYHQMVTLGTITDPNTGINGKMKYWWCSMFSTEFNLNATLRIHIPNLYLKYWWFRNTYPFQPYSVTRTWLVGEGRTLAHEFAHMFQYIHLDRDLNCPNNLLSTTTDDSYRDVFEKRHMEQIHSLLTTTNLRQFIPCEEHYQDASSDIIVAGNEVWDMNLRLYSNVIVKNGATLTITCKVLMPEEGLITVERGGKLIVDGGTVTRANTCDPTQFWRTISAHGDPSSQANGAEVRIINGGLVEGAVVGVTTGAYPNNTSDLWGATVRVDNGTFRDCRKGVEFWPFYGTNTSYFKNAKFLRTNTGSSHTGVSMWRNNGVLFERCTFTNMTRNGIVTFDASFSVQKACKFSGSSEAAIACSGADPLPLPVLIGDVADIEANRNEFTGNTIGAHITATRAEMYRNKMSNFDFDIAVIGQSITTIGKNNFSAAAAGVTLESTGSLINKTNCNYYAGTQAGIFLKGRNSGFSFEEDGFNTLIHDVYLKNAGTTLGRIGNQGSTGNGIYNYFTPGKTEQIKTEPGQTAQFTYFYPQGSSAPKCAINGVNCSPNSNFRATQTGTTKVPMCGIPGPPDEEDGCDDDVCYRPELETLIANAQNTLHTGDNSVILNVAQTGSALSDIAALQAASPYLSDAVLLATAANPGLSSVQKTAILKANAPLSPDVMEQLSGLNISNMEELEQANQQTPFSERERMRGELDALLVEKEKAINRFFAHNVANHNWTTLENVFLQDLTGHNHRRLFSVYLAQNKFVQADQVLDQMPVLNIEDQYFVQIQRVNLAHRMEPVAYQLDNATEQMLLNIAESHTEVAAYAQSLLGLLTGRFFMPELPNLTAAQEEGAGERHSKARQVESLPMKQAFTVTPNPATEMLDLRGVSITGGMVSFRHIATGQIARNVYLPDGGTLSVSIRDLPDGVYILTLTQNDRVTARQKLVIQH